LPVCRSSDKSLGKSISSAYLESNLSFRQISTALHLLTAAQQCRMKLMSKKAISPGPVHRVPADLRKVLISDPVARAKWEDITPLARNEWICWVISVKKPETRKQHIERVRSELKEGMRRPCCWPGCPHR
jgi:uncharacterized protein YdeI (YjbR/CyaY-like superfamily)